MLYTTLTVGGTEYKLRLPAKIAGDVERKLGGKSLIGVFGGGDMEDLPGIEPLITVLHGSLQVFEHGITLDKTYELYDQYIEDGGSYVGMIKVIIEVLKVSGFFKGAPEQPGTTKTEKQQQP
ncbi:putative NUDIX family phosphoesterase [Paenibacillus anaericanus]|uniref:DUF6096 family protein n=1 Tax=Paenibacillus anaericanus TaxID=170367 RepID=UPI002780312A|nr:DUF6096 family protein [Paenibacillus anaericanus]MDQ0091669.1 putative NUDIX family phosphoesterase [Paenibacillus anaericanus]